MPRVWPIYVSFCFLLGFSPGTLPDQPRHPARVRGSGRDCRPPSGWNTRGAGVGVGLQADRHHNIDRRVGVRVRIADQSPIQRVPHVEPDPGTLERGERLADVNGVEPYL